MRFGILGDAKIARNRLRPAILSAGHVITAIGRRDPSKGADQIWGDVQVMTYEGLLADCLAKSSARPFCDKSLRGRQACHLRKACRINRK